MLNEKLQKELIQQINREFEAAYIYLSMASYMESLSLDGFSHWMKLQAQEEIGHGMKIYNYLNDLGVRVTMGAIPEPPNEFSSVLEAFEMALAHEKKLAKELNEISFSAAEAKDNITVTFLDWFLTEQVEEISSTDTICDKLRLVGDNGHGMLVLNNEMLQRKPESGGKEE